MDTRAATTYDSITMKRRQTEKKNSIHEKEDRQSEDKTYQLIEHIDYPQFIQETLLSVYMN
jgi:hypothetical protein